MYAFALVLYLVVEILDFMIYVHSDLRDTGKELPKVVIPLYTPACII